jgi:uncharacterized protein (TIGR03435 family)
MTLPVPCESRMRPLLLAGVIAIAGFVAQRALAQRALAQGPPPPPPLPGVAPPAETDPNLVLPHFDVISVKPGKDAFTMMQLTADGIRGTSVTVRFLLYEGYGGINHEQVIGEPAWANQQGFDIEAKVAAADVPTWRKLTFEQRRTMFQSILTERFQLVAHHETRELPIYLLLLAKGGPRLKAVPPADPAATAQRNTGMAITNGKVTATDTRLSVLVTVLSRILGRTVVDKTGLTSAYDFTLEFAPEEGSPQPPPEGVSADAAPSIFTALKEQLGLRLEPAKGPVDVVVIDHLEKPTEN